MATFVQWQTKHRKSSKPVGWTIEENGCHLWTGSVDPCGYGQAMADGKVRKMHRFRYEREVGVVPEGMELDHFVCDNRRCCNPQHVRPTTHYENVLRGQSPTALNKAKTHCPKGHPYSGDNLIPYYTERGTRSCNACNNERSNKRYHAMSDEMRQRRRDYYRRRRAEQKAIVEGGG